MPKAERGTPKDIANRIKAKGLQKLKFYCQMCEKQCRDANGFKCHLSSESHLRQMKIFSSNAGGILDQYSQEFEQCYMSTLRMRHGTKRVNANTVYQEVIQDKHHIHMNATKWTTLSDFVQYLGKQGKCVVDETERGWYISYIERDMSILARQEAMERRLLAERQAEEKQAKQMEIQRIEAAKAYEKVKSQDQHSGPTNLEPRDETQQITVAIKKATIPKVKMSSKSSTANKRSVFENSDDDDDDVDVNVDVGNNGSDQQHEMRNQKPKYSPPVPPNQQQSKKRRDKNYDHNDDGNNHHRNESKRQKKEKAIKSSRKDYWLKRDILVRIITKSLGKQYYQRKGIVNKVLKDKYTAQIEVLDSGPDIQDGGDVIELDQDDLETVIPKIGKKVLILNGEARGEVATLLEKNDEFGTLQLESNKDNTILKHVPIEDFSKLA